MAKKYACKTQKCKTRRSTFGKVAKSARAVCVRTNDNIKDFDACVSRAMREGLSPSKYHGGRRSKAKKR